MFQDFALFPHLSVADNIAFGLRMAGQRRAATDGRVSAMLDLVNLEGYGERSVFELSGGERQRVALARSLAPEPALVMLDEPLGSLDRGLREELVEELRRILQATGVTAIYVTHDQDEALALSDRTVIMRAGQIEQVGTPQAIYTRPASDFVARFLGFQNLLPAMPQPGTEPLIETPIGLFPMAEHSLAPGSYTLLIRPEAARLAQPGEASSGGWGFQRMPEAEAVLLRAKIVACTYHGREYRVQVRVPATPQPVELTFDLPAFQRSAPSHGLAANELPPPGAAVELLVYPELATLLRLDA
jgi:ABC-type Fe3+/spermidine/putrescine transport system ATPase subunit